MNRLTIRKRKDGFEFKGDDGRSWWVKTECARVGMIGPWLPGEYVRLPDPEPAEEKVAHIRRPGGWVTNDVICGKCGIPFTESGSWTGTPNGDRLLCPYCLATGELLVEEGEDGTQ